MPAGPFFCDGDLRGTCVFDERSLEEAEALVQTGPSIRSQSLLELKKRDGGPR